jgi:hypothetical protein
MAKFSVHLPYRVLSKSANNTWFWIPPSPKWLWNDASVLWCPGLLIDSFTLSFLRQVDIFISRSFVWMLSSRCIGSTSSVNFNVAVCRRGRLFVSVNWMNWKQRFHLQLLSDRGMNQSASKVSVFLHFLEQAHRATNRCSIHCGDAALIKLGPRCFIEGKGVLGEWRYSYTHSSSRYWMEVSCQLHAPAALPPGKELLVPIG